MYSFEQFERAFSDWYEMLDRAKQYTIAQFCKAYTMLAHTYFCMTGTKEEEDRAGNAFMAVTVDWERRLPYMMMVLPME